jgi:hypothetical protein
VANGVLRGTSSDDRMIGVAMVLDNTIHVPFDSSFQFSVESGELVMCELVSVWRFTLEQSVLSGGHRTSSRRTGGRSRRDLRCCDRTRKGLGDEPVLVLHQIHASKFDVVVEFGERRRIGGLPHGGRGAVFERSKVLLRY